MTILVTGAAGFIGYHVAQALLARGDVVLGVDDLNAYYDPALKRARLARLEALPGFRFVELDIADRAAVDAMAASEPGFTGIVHLAAQAGVRYSIENPYVYVRTNVLGHVVLLEAARHMPRLRHFVYASSSSVYGGNERMPFHEDDRVDRPLSVYAATKRADELLSHAYLQLHGLPQTGLRFFTVYGPWGRPDMAYYKFAQAIVSGTPVVLYEGGTLRRDFTYVDDVVTGVLAALDRPPAAGAPARVLNIGNDQSELVTTLLRLLEQALGRRAVVQTAPRPLADTPATLASIDAIAALTGYRATTPLAVGIPRFVAWFREWHRV